MAKLAVLGYAMGGVQIKTKGRQADKRQAPILVVAPHSSFLDAIIIHVCEYSSPLARDNDQTFGSKWNIFLAFPCFSGDTNPGAPDEYGARTKAILDTSLCSILVPFYP